MTNIDEDRPTILRKLTTIENKLDSLQIIETQLDRSSKTASQEFITAIEV